MIKLNLGCGDRYASGWVNVDLPDMPHRADQRVDLNGDLPWAARSVACVYAGHVLEHMLFADALSFLQRLLPRMINNGAIMLVGPDLNRARELIPADGSDEFGATISSLLHGAGRWAGDVHHWECTEARLVQLLTDAGWHAVTPMNMDEVKLFWPVADARPRWQACVGALARHEEVR